MLKAVLNERLDKIRLSVEAAWDNDDCGFSPFSDDIATSRETAFAKIAARIQGRSWRMSS